MCDAPASGCPEWSDHCKATHSSLAWQQKRALWQKHGGKPPAGAATSDGASSSSPDRHVRVCRWSCDEILAKIQQVYPEEVAEPPGFPQGLTLRPYQRQSLAYMLHNERSVDASLEGTRTRLVSVQQKYGRSVHTVWKPVKGDSGVPCRGGFLCDEVQSFDGIQRAWTRPDERSMS